MFRIKRLYSFVLWTFLPLLLATFSVCLFVLLMQFLWKYVDDMVGKGVEMKVLGELFFYAANFLVPMALPIAILLASLMTFGSLGEHLELLAMKASGISILRIMKPLIVLSIFISGTAFVFQNNVLPGAQVKLWTIVYSLRMKSPELDIPVGSFYNVITGYNLYVRHKDKTGLLRDVMIYDYSKGFDNLIVTMSDSGRMKISEDKKYLVLTLLNGESFQNVGNMGANRSVYNQKQISFRREKFSMRDILIEFDSNFNMADESMMQGRDISKNIPALRSFIRAKSEENDSVARLISPPFINQVTTVFKQEKSYPANNHLPADTLHINNFASFYKSLPVSKQLQILDNAKMKTDRMMNDFNIRMYEQSNIQKEIRGHQIELHRKFAYSIACLLFFFIGAPLGAIIRKGGLGLPAILAVTIFILYYTIDTFGWKMAKQDSWPVWEGIWLSAFVLVCLGTFLTYKAVNDSVVMNPDAWKQALERLIGKREIRNYTRKELIMEAPDYPKAVHSMEKWDKEANIYLQQKQKIPFYISFWKQDFQNMQLDNLLAPMNDWVEDLLNSNENLIIGKLMDYPVITPYHWTFLNRPAVRWSCAIISPAGILIYILWFLKQRQMNSDLQTTIKVNEEISKELRNLNYVIARKNDEAITQYL
jgi:lipopolysaccharide export system permease protein